MSMRIQKDKKDMAENLLKYLSRKGKATVNEIVTEFPEYNKEDIIKVLMKMNGWYVKTSYSPIRGEGKYWSLV